MDRGGVDRRRDWALAGALFLLLAARCCAFGFRYWPQLDDYIQYHNYPTSDSFWQLHQSVGLLASRPLAGLADFFLWGRDFDRLILGVLLICALYAAGVVLVKNLLERHFRLGPVFPVVMALLPLGMEGTYWMSASSRVVVGLFFAALAAWVFVRWLDTGKRGWLCLYLPLQLLPFGFYEQSGIFAVTLTVGLAILEVLLRDRGRLRRALLCLWSVACIPIYFLVTSLFSRGGVYASRAEPVKRGIAQVLRLAGRYWPLLAVAAAGLCVLLWLLVRRLRKAGRRERVRWLILLLALLAAGAAGVFLLLLRTSIFRYYLTTILPDILGQIGDVFLRGNFYTIFKGTARGMKLIFSGELLLWGVAAAGLCLLLWLVLRRGSGLGGERGRFWLALLSGVLLAAAPLTVFLVVGNPWFSFRGAATSFAGLALAADTLVEALWRRLSLRRDGPAVLAAALALVFLVAGASEVGDYKATYENDQRLAREVLRDLRRDFPTPESAAGLRAGLLGVEASYLPDQNYFWHEHIHGCTESDWAFSGLLTSTGENIGLPAVAPLPTWPVYRAWNAEAARPEGFDVLYYYDGTGLERVKLIPRDSGEHDFGVYRENGELLGELWEEEGRIGYFQLDQKGPA